MMNLAVKTRNCVSKTRNFVSKNEDFCTKNDEFCSGLGSTVHLQLLDLLGVTTDVTPRQ